MPDETLPNAATLVEMLRQRAEQYGDKVAFTFSYNGDDEDCHRLTYRDLDTRARAVAATLQAQGAAGERVLVLVRPGLDFIAGFFGCLYAGAVAVPVHQKLAPRLATVVPDAQAGFALATVDTRANTIAAVDGLAEGKTLRWCMIEDAAAVDPDAWVAPAVGPGTDALIQYTSGSTRSPKGVVLTHGNLMHNLTAMRETWPGDDTVVGVFWLPPHHDMGLISAILQMLSLGASGVLMSPAAFIKQPMRWLEAISRNRGTYTIAPTFAYDRCVERSTPAERAALDLSNLVTAHIGAEPVRVETLQRFTEAFAPAGFRMEMFHPAYGLAEATVGVSGAADAQPPGVRYVDRNAFGEDRIVDVTADDPAAVALVGCGRLLDGQHVVIVDPVTCAPCGPDEVGEIWIAGPSVAKGYWGRPEETAQTFGWQLASSAARSDEGPFVRSGDLGFLCGGELFIVGRVKDLITVDGHNYYPSYLEATAQECSPALASGRGAAFTVDPPGLGMVEDVVAQLVLVQEVDPEHVARADLEAVLDTVCAAITRQHGIEPHAVVLVQPLSIPTTSSGKIQRYQCRQQYLDDGLAVVAQCGGSPPQPLSLADLEAAAGMVADLEATAVAQQAFPQG
ncbi:fatty acyl-AMP ligase [Mycobacterium sp. M1]|uniref:Fatty acyl-AMP ligase n=1 Tax=Mycolicibacter acidiphilus TaxID=2835306 RepID=A0ABS5RP26_9MYCO|nr:fatty acyl-AMP ligase [Mycolicibacter acidiphilus]MBS9536055.1 fatty acyl-AMP ligase [Mycolicibacter acidiphilus]